MVVSKAFISPSKFRESISNYAPSTEAWPRDSCIFLTISAFGVPKGAGQRKLRRYRRWWYLNFSPGMIFSNGAFYCWTR